MSSSSFNTLRTMQKNVQQVHTNFWTLKLDGSHKTISNIIKVAPNDYRVTLNSLSHKTFMKALASLISVYEETLFSVNKCKESSTYDAPRSDNGVFALEIYKLMKVAKVIKKSVVSVMVFCAVSGAAQASNVDVINFLNKAQIVAANPADSNAVTDAANDFDNLNARDRLVVKEAADLTSYQSAISDIVGVAESRGHAASVPAGWDEKATRAQLDAAHAPKDMYEAQAASNNAKRAAYLAAHPKANPAPPAPSRLDSVMSGLGVTVLEVGTGSQPAVQHPSQDELRKHFAELKAAQVEKAKTDGLKKILDNRSRTSSQHVDGTAAAVANHETAQDSSIAQVQQNTNWNAVKVEDAHHAIMVAQVDIDKNADDIKGAALEQANRERTASQKVEAVTPSTLQSVDAKNTQQDSAIHHAQVNADAALKGNMAQSKHIKTNADDIDTLKGVALQEANRERSASQHVAAPTPKDGKDGVTTVITDTATQEAVKGLQLIQANQSRTMSEHVTTSTPAPVNGKDGVTTVKVDTATQSTVASNSKELRAVRTEQKAAEEYAQKQAKANSRNIELMHGEVISEAHARYNGDVASVKSANGYTDQRIKSVEDQQSNDRKEYRAGIAGAISISGLHYVDTDNSVAIGAGSFKDAQGYALGYRHKFSDNVAATVAASETSNGDAALSASAAIGW